ncbi:MAG: patatin-like phospholipase family protein, partial [Actinomycetota bacterium]|nr:patatin-like phospholipase family protein [Actinomycetota bacterium]
MSDAGDVGDDPRQADPDRAGVAVVVAGASARGAYEAGVLSVLLPALEAQGLRPDIFVGSSAGAINSVAFAAMSNLSAEAAGTKATDLWRSIQQGDVFRPPLRSTLAAVGGWVARASRPRTPPRPAGVLDTSPLEATLARLIDWNQLHANISDHRVTAVAVTATACSTHRTTVFVEQGAGRRLPASDPGRAIDYLGADLDRRH